MNSSCDTCEVHSCEEEKNLAMADEVFDFAQQKSDACFVLYCVNVTDLKLSQLI